MKRGIGLFCFKCCVGLTRSESCNTNKQNKKAIFHAGWIDDWVGKFNDKKEACTFIKAQANVDFNP